MGATNFLKYFSHDVLVIMADGALGSIRILDMLTHMERSLFMN